MAADERHTPVSLLVRLKGRHQPEDWRRFVGIYGPLIFAWGRRQQLQPEDAADLTQEVLATVAKSIGRWEQDPERAPFRAWLWTVTRNKLTDIRRRERRWQQGSGDTQTLKLFDRLESRDDGLQRDWDETYANEVLAGALRLLKPQFSSVTWQAFEKQVWEELPPKQVSEELGISLNAVYVAKSRVLGRLRQELAGLIDEESEL